jgi:hypothetical protein
MIPWNSLLIVECSTTKLPTKIINEMRQLIDETLENMVYGFLIL